MKNFYKPFIALSILSAASAHAAWDQQCVDDCFRTHHECNYCDYQCRVDTNPPEIRDIGPQYRCPFNEQNY
ncbi:MAG TPA: hypothetical protein VL360_08610 [Gammaproteobacteria bacterium]|nr:hypothetical protein [Gammaproteobacteria bacterium]